MIDKQKLEDLASILEQSGEYKVLRRLKPRLPVQRQANDEIRLGLFVDVETTGLDHNKDEILELAMLPFRYSIDGTVVEVLEAFDRLREPSSPIPPEITALTGITDAMVAGKTIDPDEVSRVASPAVLVIAHNAAFDRRFVERFCPLFATKPWACSMAEINWSAEGFEGVKLAYLAASFGFFYERHRAANDCMAALEILSRTLPRSGVSALGKLLAQARQSTWRIWAENSPFELKDKLKVRGYRWNGENNGRPKSWYIDVPEDSKDMELEFLCREIYRRNVDIGCVKLTAYDRYSGRA